METLMIQRIEEPSESPLAQEEQAFHQQQAWLLRYYEGQYVALYQGRMVEHDGDDEELAQRMYEKWGDVPFYIAKVEKEPTFFEI